MSIHQQEVQRGRELAKGARYKKNGSKSKKCSLPSDNLTNKQRKELSGKPMSLKMNEPMRFAEFNALSKYLKQEYIEHLSKTYNLDWSRLAWMFRVSPAIVKSRFAKDGVEFKSKRGRMIAKDLEAFTVFVVGEQKEDVIFTTTYDELKEEGYDVSKITHREPTGSMKMSNFTLRYTGRICAVEIGEQLEKLIGETKGEISIIFKGGV